MKIHQAAFIDSMLECFNITSTRSVPADPYTDLRGRSPDEEPAKAEYWQAVGCLMWAANMTRPDVANAVREVARHSHDPSASHWSAVCHILRYLHGTSSLGLIFRRGHGLDMEVYADSDYARSKVDHKSVTGSAILCGKSLISWISRTQKCVTTSITEAEYVAMAEAVKDALFVRDVLVFLVPSRKGKCITVREDNQGAISLASNPLSSARSRHIDVRFHLREKVEKKEICIVHTSTEEQYADMLTKPLQRKLFMTHRDSLMSLVQ